MIDYAKRVAGLRDEDLMEVAFSNDRDGFDPVYVAVALKEASRRGLTTADWAYGIDLERERTKLEREKEIRDALQYIKHKIPLKRSGGIMFLFFSFLVFPSLIAASILFIMGYRRKAKDAILYISIGFPTWILLLLISGFVRINIG